MPGVSQEQFTGFIRHVVTFVGGILVARGRVDAVTVETVSGVIVTITGLIWSFVAKKEPPKS